MYDQKIENATEAKNKRIAAYVDRKSKEICYFNSVNSAIAIQQGKDFDWEQFVADRDKLYELWQEWFIREILPDEK